jgi:hypothetical protein
MNDDFLGPDSAVGVHYLVHADLDMVSFEDKLLALNRPLCH